MHLYWISYELPTTTRAMHTCWGNLELCGHGCQVVAPPSSHPQTQRRYVVEQALPILNLPDMADVVDWLRSLNRKSPPALPLARRYASGRFQLNVAVQQAIVRELLRRGFRQRGEWLNGSCIFPEQHKNDDAHPSFGYNLTSNCGFCYVCGTVLAKVICSTLGVDPFLLGGLASPH